MKKLLWTALVMTVSTTAATLAARGARRLWTKIAAEPPPEAPFWARLLVGRSMRAAS